MRIDMKQTLIARGKTPMKYENEDATLGLIAYAALITLSDNVDRAERLKRGRLALRIEAADGTIELKAEEIALIKECIGKIFPPLVVVQTEDMLEHESPKLSIA